MPRSYRIVRDGGYAYFVTCSVVNKLPLLKKPIYRQIILDSLAYLREHKATQLNAFVVMSTHLHAVLWPQNGIDMSDVLRDFKRHTSRTISREATKQGHDYHLQVFAAARSTFRSERAEYQVWQEGSHPEAIYDDDFARQKIEYIHNNPVKAGLVSKAEYWPYSSARAYLLREPTYPPTDIMDLR
ncbi:MAG: transposase [Planctomycetes bacterium]|nr:transposase [Planctomycetota bacterium]MBU4400498.1 transposase [Planctomycetota bacterium]MCG2682684.1 transposase [Planctomycetales bacterium]